MDNGLSGKTDANWRIRTGTGSGSRTDTGILPPVGAGKPIRAAKGTQALKDALIRLHPEPLTLLFDYVRIRFPTMDVKHIIEDVLRLKMKYLVQEPRGMYGYTRLTGLVT